MTFSFSLVVSDEQAEALPEAYEAVYGDELDEVNLLAMIEDEIIISFSIALVHAPEYCEVSTTERLFGINYPSRRKNLIYFPYSVNLKHK